MGDNIPKANVVTIFFPRSKDIEQEQLRRLVNTQNKGLNTQLWKVLSSKTEGSGRLVSVAIDEQSRGNIMEVDSYILFQFRKIPIHRVKKKPEGLKNGERGALPVPMLLKQPRWCRVPGMKNRALQPSAWKVNCEAAGK